VIPYTALPTSGRGRFEAPSTANGKPISPSAMKMDLPSCQNLNLLPVTGDYSKDGIGATRILKILPVPADGMNVESLWYRFQFPDDGQTCRRIVLGCLTTRLRLFGLRFGIR
ncbi:hypothetical protein Tco_1468619, partial [Tanacetum coccineum]